MLSKSHLFQGPLLVHRPELTHAQFQESPPGSSQLQVLRSAKVGLSSNTVTKQRTAWRCD